MATRTLKARVELDGEKQYKQALSELNQGNKVLASEMKKLQAEYKGNADSVEYLNKKGDVLQRQLQQQKDKVKALQDAVAASAKKYGEADKKTQDWIIKLNNAEAAQYDLEHAIEENTEAIEKQGKEMTGMGDAVDGFASKLGINIPKGAKDALNGMNGLSKGTVAAMGVAAGAVVALIKVVKELQDTTLDAAHRADEIMTKANQMNISAQQYQALQYASPFVDVDVDTMAGSLSKLTKAMGDAASGSEQAKQKFRDLGVSITDADGSLRSAYDVWLDTMDAIGQMTDATEQDIAAQELLGKSASDLAGIYREGTESLREYTEAAYDSYVMSDDQLEQLGAVDDAWQKLQLDIEHNKDQIALQWSPAAKKALEQFDKLVTAAGKALTDSGIITGFAEIVKYAVALIDPIVSLLNTADGAPDRLRPVYEILHGIAGVFAWIADAANVVAGILTLDGSRIKTALGFGRDSGNFSNMQQWMGYTTEGQYRDEETGLWTGNYGRNATGNDNWRGGLTWVGEAGPELVALPSGSQIYNAQDAGQLGGDYYITINVDRIEDLQDVIDLVQSARVRSRMKR